MVVVGSRLANSHTVAIPMRYVSTSTIQQRIPLDSCVFVELDVTNAFYMLEVEPESLISWHSQPHLEFSVVCTCPLG